MIAEIFRTSPIVPQWHAHQAKPSVAIPTCVSTRRGYAIETTIVKTSGTRAKRCVTTRPARLTASAVHQGIVSPCAGTAMERMTVETAVMRGPVEQGTRPALVGSFHVAMVCQCCVQFCALNCWAISGKFVPLFRIVDAS